MDRPELDQARAYVLTSAGAPLVRAPQSLRPPGPAEALIRIEACGVCGSDVFLQKGGFGLDKFPVVPGHEAAGRVVAVGDGVDEHWLGTQVALYYISGPTDSPWYRAGLENLGPDISRMGVDADGAFADYVVRPLDTLVPISPEMDATQVAVATDALATPFHALTRIARLQAGETLAVIGPGGIGSNAVQIGKLLGAHVIAVGRSETKLELAGRLGADALVHASEGVAAVARAGPPPDVVLQCAGTPDMDRFAIDIAGFRSRVVMVGTSLGQFDLASRELVWRELALLGSRGFVRQDIADVIDLVRDGSLTTTHLTTDVRPMDDADAALNDLRNGRTMRTVLVN